MFEGNFSQTGCDRAGNGTGLRPISWAELSARLAAARDLRDVLRPAAAASGSASFASGAAAQFAAQGEGIRNVNPDALGAGKTPRGIAGSPAEDSAGGDRE